MLKKLLKTVGIVVGILVLAVGAFIYSIFGDQQRPRTGPPLPHGIEQVADNIATIFVLDAGAGKVVLVDAGNDPSGGPTIEALKKRAKSPDDVSAIFITHSHPDHSGAVGVFHHADVYAMQDEVDVASGLKPYGSPISKILGATNPHPFKITHPLQDGETVKVGDLSVTAFEISGHTPGSAAFLTQGTLFTGDAFGITRDLKISGPVKVFTGDYPQAIESLRGLLKKLSGHESEVQVIATSHSGTLPGPQGLQKLREFLSTVQP